MDKTRIALEALITEREGMLAENDQRAYEGQAMAFGDDAFQVLAGRIQRVGEEKQEIGEPGGLRRCDVSNVLCLAVYLVIQRRAGPKAKHDIRNDIMGGFAVAEDGMKWINRQHNPEAYFLEPLKVIGQGGGE